MSVRRVFLFSCCWRLDRPPSLLSNEDIVLTDPERKGWKEERLDSDADPVPERRGGVLYVRDHSETRPRCRILWPYPVRVPTQQRAGCPAHESTHLSSDGILNTRFKPATEPRHVDGGDMEGHGSSREDGWRLTIYVTFIPSLGPVGQDDNLVLGTRCQLPRAKVGSAQHLLSGVLRVPSKRGAQMLCIAVEGYSWTPRLACSALVLSKTSGLNGTSMHQLQRYYRTLPEPSTPNEASMNQPQR